MCGITGIISTAGQLGSHELRTITAVMTDTLRHRGPDDSGIWVDAEAGIALGHRRLAILDLSPAGSQPMQSACGRYVIAFNGEIYNYREIRSELESAAQGGKFPWRGHSDTEVLLAAFGQWGLESALKKLSGMFAFALWDRQERVVHLVRDRIGEKPLYFGHVGNTFLFGSELKAFRAFPGWKGEINRNALALFMRHSCIPAPYSIYQDISKLLPGTVLTIPLARVKHRSTTGDLTPKPYWSASAIAELGSNYEFSGTEAEAIEQLDHLLRASVRQQMAADVPLGAFLSGGVDSSTIVALMQAQSSRPIKSFTVGFQEKDYNEAHYAKEVARHFGTDHTELYVMPETALSVIPKLPEIYDEPFSDASQIPTYLISQLTRNHVTVCLSGDAGDELFAGYNRYLWGNSLWRSLDRMPNLMKTISAGLLGTFSPGTWELFFRMLDPVLPTRLRHRNSGDKIQKLTRVLTADNPSELYRRLVSHWDKPDSIVTGAIEPATLLTDRSSWPDLKNFQKLMMYLDLVTFLPDDILTKVDRASMGVSLETRLPYLDHRVVEFAWSLPLSMKIRNGQGKWLLRQVLYRYVPRELIERPKSGFAVPLDSWLRGPLREWAEDLLEERRLRQEGYLNHVPIRQKWQEHLSGKRNWQYQLWDVLMFQAWLSHQSQSA